MFEFTRYGNLSAVEIAESSEKFDCSDVFDFVGGVELAVCSCGLPYFNRPLRWHFTVTHFRQKSRICNELHDFSCVRPVPTKNNHEASPIRGCVNGVSQYDCGRNTKPERWLSGRKHRFAKSAYGFTRTTSSNLVLSAFKLRFPDVFWEISAFFTSAGSGSSLSAFSIEVSSRCVEMQGKVPRSCKPDCKTFTRCDVRLSVPVARNSKWSSGCGV